MNGLAHLTDRSTLELERPDVEHGLVAVVERMQTVRPVAVEARLGCAEDRDPPVARVGEGDEAVDEVRELLGRADRVAGDDRDAADDAVGEERALTLAEEIRLVGAEHERRERVDPPGRDERTRQLAVADAVGEPVAPRCEPGHKQRDSGR